MIVNIPHRKLVLNLRHPGSVVGVVPGAREFQFKGHPLVAVPHGVHETRVLRNLNIAAPSPILHHYDWPNGGKKSPMAHQRVTAAFLTLNPRAYLLSEMGTCKTLTVLWAYHYLKQSNVIDAMVVIAPLSALERAWGDEIFGNFFDTDFATVHGDTDKRLKRLNEDKDVYIINHDGVKNEAVAAEITRRVIRRYGKDRVLIVIDELGEYRNAGSDRWQALNTLIQPCTWVWGLTGTPTPKAPTDAWAECRLITPWTVPKYFSRFRARTMRKVTHYKWVALPNANDIVHEVMQPGIRFRRDECFDLPPITTSYAHVELTREQRAAYTEMLDRSRVELEGGQVTALNEGVKLQKLVQIAAGVLYDGEKHHEIPTGPRTALVLEKIEQSSNKVILFVPLSGALTRIAKAIADAGYSVAVVDGGTSKTARDLIFGDFQARANPHVIVAQPGCMSHALTLTAANTIIWYCPPNSNAIYEQANARIPRPGQKSNMFIIHIEGTAVERAIYQRLENQGSLQGTLLAAYERERTERA